MERSTGAILEYEDVTSGDTPTLVFPGGGGVPPRLINHMK